MPTATKITVKWTPRQLMRRHAARNRQVLFRQGAYLKTTMQRSMRYSRKVSQPGQPPHARKNNPLLRKLIKFAVDLAQQSVICGPEKFGGSRVRASQPLPQLLDQGGDVTIEVKGVPVIAHIAPRPFTAPVFTDGGENFRKLISSVPL